VLIILVSQKVHKFQIFRYEKVLKILKNPFKSMKSAVKSGKIRGFCSFFIALSVEARA